MAFIIMRLDEGKRERKSLTQRQPQSTATSNSNGERGRAWRESTSFATGRQEELRAEDEVLTLRKLIQQNNLNLKNKTRVAKTEENSKKECTKDNHKNNETHIQLSS